MTSPRGTTGDPVTEPSEVLVVRDGDVVTITLNRPDARNAQTPRMWQRMRAIARDLTADVRIVVVRGAGSAFSAGLDTAAFRGVPLPGGPSLPEMARMPEQECDAVIAGYQEAFSWLRRPDLLSIAAVAGPAIGAGCQLALACDLRVVADDARFALPEATLGLVPDLGGTKRLVELVGYARALEICLTGRRVDAAEAARLGLATVAVAGHELDDAVSDLVAALLATPRDAAVETKALLLGAAVRSDAEQLAAERAAQARRLRDLAGAGE